MLPVVVAVVVCRLLLLRFRVVRVVVAVVVCRLLLLRFRVVRVVVAVVVCRLLLLRFRVVRVVVVAVVCRLRPPASPAVPVVVLAAACLLRLPVYRVLPSRMPPASPPVMPVRPVPRSPTRRALCPQTQAHPWLTPQQAWPVPAVAPARVAGPVPVLRVPSVHRWLTPPVPCRSPDPTVLPSPMPADSCRRLLLLTFPPPRWPMRPVRYRRPRQRCRTARSAAVVTRHPARLPASPVVPVAVAVVVCRLLLLRSRVVLAVVAVVVCRLLLLRSRVVLAVVAVVVCRLLLLRSPAA
ncbi:hypothetical protein ACXDF8_05945 [Mycolicibacterium sp. CBM1]